MPPSGVDYASEFLNGYAPEYVHFHEIAKITPKTCPNHAILCP